VLESGFHVDDDVATVVVSAFADYVTDEAADRGVGAA
jgi:hypothetical protein